MNVIAKNRRANFDYDTNERIVAGIVLAGHEAKSIRAGHISLKGSFVSIRNHEAWLTNAHISKYANAAIENYDPIRPRKLLIKNRELKHIISCKQNGYSVYPLSVGIDKKFIKMEIGIGKGKKLYDKRMTIKKRDEIRDINRHFKQKS
ncbi:SsrA-binding protein SmpB [Candidatus Saccharibacteria bacterium CPR2]|nr:SsrA-binding protein SmpB [Candidatus Saccharibacteria bacterium CPR2]